MSKHMQKPHGYMVMDIESIGLFGPAWAFGFVVMDENFVTIEEGYTCCNPAAITSYYHPKDYQWIMENVVPHCPVTTELYALVGAEFWVAWQKYHAEGYQLWADCCFPVETNFIAQVLEKDEYSRSKSPYPLYDLATLLFARGYDPTATFARLEDELPAHNPLADAKQSARILKTLLKGESLL